MRSPLSPREHLAAFAALVPRAARAGWAGGIALVVGLIVTALWVVSTARLYRSEAVIVYERGVQSTALGRDSEPPRVLATRLNDMVMSRQRLEGIIKEMNLYPGTVEKKGMVEAIDEMRKHVALVNREGYTYKVSYDGRSRDAAKDVLDRLVAALLKEDGQRRRKEADEARRFLDSERERADGDLKTKESALATFLAQHPQLAGETGAATAGGLIRAADRDRGSASGGELASLELQAAQIEESLAAAGAVRQAGTKVILEQDPQLLAARTRAQTELHTAQRDLAEKQMHLTNEHPDVKHAMRRITDAEAGLRRAEAALAASKPIEHGTTGPAEGGTANSARIVALQHALAAVRQQASAIRSRAVPRAEAPKTVNSAVAIDTEWIRLNREVGEARERQTQIEGKQFQAGLALTLADGGQAGQLVVVDPPFKPMRPVAGGRFKIAVAGGVGSLLLAILVIGLFAAFDDRLYGARDLESLLTDGIVVQVPRSVQPRLEAPKPAADGG